MNWWDCERAASSVIGIILLVALTVIIGATTSGFVFNTANENTTTPPPQGVFTFDYAKDGDTRESVPSDNLTITYTAGDDISGSNLNFTLSGAREFNQNGNPEGTDDLYVTRGLFGSGTISSGDQDRISENNVESRSGGPLGDLRALDLQEAVVRIYWSDPNSDTSSIIAEWEGSKA
jgi:FlaG/FlaF family flagellin (archaellin)